MIEFMKIGAARHAGHAAEFSLEDGHTLRVAILAGDLARVTLLPKSGYPVDRSWMVAPGGDTPPEGRPRAGDAGFACPPATLETVDGEHRVAAGDIRVRVTGEPLRLVFERRGADGDFRAVLSDRESAAYVRADEGRRLRHYQARDTDERYFGLGDKTGPLDRAGRRFRCLQLDALGYDAEHGDPLYKHVPFFVVRNPDASVAGLFYDTLSPVAVDLGCERSNYHGIYRHVEVEEPALDYYVLFGGRIADIVEGFARLTGLPYLPPRWSFGFAFTTMHHADDANAQAKIGGFAERCRAERIPISAVHFGSGYSSRGKRRYVFTWNRDKFPDPAALFARLRALELKTVANLKPVLIDDHPAYAERAGSQGFLRGRDGKPVVEQFWDGHGSFLDFTNEATAEWWKKNLSAQVLDVGFDAGWNDNNEYEAWRDGATSHGFGRAVPVSASRPLHALLMTRATFEETRRRTPDKRPFTITRAGPPGIQRYAETWSGDNFTSWHTLKWNIRNGLSMALSGMAKVGHDIGGFAGPQPDAELLCRWVEMMALHPRAVMNSWKPAVGAATEPWTHPSVLDAVRAALELRYRLLPVMYTQAWLAHVRGTPPIAPLFYHYDRDPACFAEHDAFLIGPDLLAAPVVEPDARTKRVYLPAGPEGWVDFHTGKLHAAGTHTQVDAPLGRPPLFVRVGAALVLAAREIQLARPHDTAARTLYAVPGIDAGTGGSAHFEDDGESWSLATGDHFAGRVELVWDNANMRVAVRREGGTRTLAAGDFRIESPTAGSRRIHTG
ncbi:MAG: alpha-glucosidase [Proteobacteria bacterium]|nr:alpha-glucosidase [Pseudomonadota bacterium]